MTPRPTCRSNKAVEVRARPPGVTALMTDGAQGGATGRPLCTAQSAQAGVDGCAVQGAAATSSLCMDQPAEGRGNGWMMHKVGRRGRLCAPLSQSEPGQWLSGAQRRTQRAEWSSTSSQTLSTHATVNWPLESAKHQTGQSRRGRSDRPHDRRNGSGPAAARSVEAGGGRR